VKRLSEILSDGNASGVYFLEGPVRMETLRELAMENDLAFFSLQGTDIRGKDRFLQTAAEVLGFPDYFGNNWDAFEDCLKDMSWHPAEGYMIVLDLVDPFVDHAPEDFRTAMDIFADSAVFWREQGKKMIVLLAGTKRKAGIGESVAL
jgi:hypothetical protein